MLTPITVTTSSRLRSTTTQPANTAKATNTAASATQIMIWVALAAVFVALAVLAGWVVVLRRRLLVVTVIGVSMEPTYSSGDRLLVRRSRLKGIRTGQIVGVQVSGA